MAFVNARVFVERLTACVMMSLFAAGCASYRVATSLQPKKPAAPISFSRENTSWMSILPTGWIPVPGGKGERAWGMASAIQKGCDLTLSSCVEAIVTAIRRVDAETWPKLSPAGVSDKKK